MFESSCEYINKLIKEGKFLLVKADLDDTKLYEYLSQRILELVGDTTKIITLVGGVASGKTTLANELVNQLGSADSITTDVFAAGTREYRHTQYGNVEKKYDLELYQQKIEALRNLDMDQSVKFPQYDEATGIAAAAGEEGFPKTVKKVNYFIIEGDFNFSKGQADLSIYFHVPDEIRTRNRIARDVKQRGWADTEKLERDIRIRDEKQHFPFTLPNAETSDILIVVTEKDSQYVYSVYKKIK